MYWKIKKRIWRDFGYHREYNKILLISFLVIREASKGIMEYLKFSGSVPLRKGLRKIKIIEISHDETFALIAL